MKVPRSVLVISHDILLVSIVESMVQKVGNPICFRDFKLALDFIYNSVPDLIILELPEENAPDIRILNDLKSDPIFGQIPVIVILHDKFRIPVWEQLLAEDFVRRSAIEGELRSRIELALSRTERIVEINPLTRLPGNITITRQIQRRLDARETFAVGYADIDFFKPFNDKYGFSRGDEVLKMTGRLILNIVKEHQAHGSFIGHVGGDDFIFIMDYASIENAAGRITEYFDKLIATFYDSDDRAKGEISSIDREGKQKIFPLMTLSIGIAHNKHRKFTHYSQMSQVASEMKSFSKSATGSCFQIDRRKK